MRSLHTATRESPPLATTTETPHVATKTQCSQKQSLNKKTVFKSGLLQGLQVLCALPHPLTTPLKKTCIYPCGYLFQCSSFFGQIHISTWYHFLRPEGLPLTFLSSLPLVINSFSFCMSEKICIVSPFLKTFFLGIVFRLTVLFSFRT